MATPDMYTVSGGSNDNMPFTSYPLPPQPVANRGGGPPKYWLPYDAYMPQQQFDTNPESLNEIKNPKRRRKVQKQLEAANQKEYYRQLAASSVNVRNRSLQEVLGRLNMPLENVAAAGGIDTAAQNFRQNQGQLSAMLAQRGLIGSGAESTGRNANLMGYLSNTANVREDARNLEDTRRQGALQDLLNLSTADVQFADAMRTGSLPLSPPNFHAADYYMMAKGIGTAVRTLASMGAGAAAGAGAAGGGGQSMGGFSAGEGGMSSLAGGESAFAGMGGGGIGAWGGAGTYGGSLGGAAGGGGFLSSLGNQWQNMGTYQRGMMLANMSAPQGDYNFSNYYGS